jgi:low affinity Fe/Cu permease
VIEVGRRLARASPSVVGSASAFLFLLGTTAVWLAIGPVFDFSANWLLVPSAVASIVALLLVVLLQYSQNRDTRAIQLKLDEVIRSVDAARTQLVGLEHRSDEELERIAEEFDELREEAHEGATPGGSPRG